MSGDPEMMLLARIIDTGDIVTAIEAGVGDDWFASERGRLSWVCDALILGAAPRGAHRGGIHPALP